MAKITKGRGTFFPKRLRIARTRWMPSQSFLAWRHQQVIKSAEETLAWIDRLKSEVDQNIADLEAQLNPPPEPSRSWFFGVFT